MSVGGSSYWYSNNTYYTRVYSGGSVANQVCAPPAGAIIATLPAGCTTARVGGVSYQRCGSTYYQRVGSGYQVVVLHGSTSSHYRKEQSCWIRRNSSSHRHFEPSSS
jgi:hypothetical protein